MKHKKLLLVLGIVAAILVAVFLLIGLNANNFDYALSRRIPKIIAMILVGISIGFSSLVFQTITNNRILTPSILGLDSLYVLLQTTLIFILGSGSGVVNGKNANFVISIVIMIIFSSLIYKFIFRKNSSNIFSLLLIGVICGTLFESLTTFMQVLIDPLEFQMVQDKMMASFNNINTEILLISTVVIALCIIFSMDFLKILDVMSLGRDEAINLGVDYDKVTKKMLVVIVILTSVSTALVGPITFLGLLVVNIARQLVKTYKHSELGLATGVISVIALIGGQLVVERILNFGMTIGVIINFVGGIYFIYLVMKERAK
ncbi:MAG: iron chelate uptake ABC transporter family permease subunit [Clostridium paraputrificum]|uniref:iron chelate uptake ABC transporter family permease subunit n=1 Tax=Clostridium paraputrificum TaxID=29363 RepID=UPI000C0880D9|nr:iron chelate uptake ABC transporter family permease subunit [Clostridium paraputrificum]MDB2110333.1 iron chelate uptake ABC transporter family permease subunit [Clostridium paraputrificum]